MKQHALSAIFPAMSETDYIDLKAHMAEHGQQSAIATFDGMVLDGWHRYRACGELGLQPKLRELPKGTDPLAFVLGQNLQRRHLSAGQRAVIVATATKWAEDGQPKKSTGSLDPVLSTIAKAAKAAGSTEPTMKRAKAVVEAGRGADVISGKITVTKAAAEVAEAKKTKPSKDKPETVRDATGYAIPEKLVPLWNRRAEVKEIQNDIASVVRRVKEVREKPDPLWQPVNMQAVEISLNNCKRDLDGAIPHAVCTICQGRSADSCTACKGRGFISKHHFDTCVPEELKQIRDKSCVK